MEVALDVERGLGNIYHPNPQWFRWLSWFSGCQKSESGDGYPTVPIRHFCGPTADLNSKSFLFASTGARLKCLRAVYRLLDGTHKGRLIEWLEQARNPRGATGQRFCFLIIPATHQYRRYLPSSGGEMLPQLNARHTGHINIPIGDRYSCKATYLQDNSAHCRNKAQGVTVERSFVLATPGMDRHLAYIRTRKPATLSRDLARRTEESSSTIITVGFRSDDNLFNRLMGGHERAFCSI